MYEHCTAAAAIRSRRRRIPRRFVAWLRLFQFHSLKMWLINKKRKSHTNTYTHSQDAIINYTTFIYVQLWAQLSNNIRLTTRRRSRWNRMRRDWSMKINTNRKAMNTSSSSPTSCCHWTWKMWEMSDLCVVYCMRSRVLRQRKKNEMLNYGLDTNEVVLKQFAFNCVEDNFFFL